MDLRYALDDLPPWRETALYALQWLAIALPGILIIGRVVGLLQFPGDPAGQVLFLQKTCFVVALTMTVQILWGHRLPLVAGPAAVLLVGVTASHGAAPAAVYTAILAGGVLLAGVSAAGLFRYVQRLFTPRVIAAVLLLIAFTLLPTILRLLTPAGPVPPLHNLLFALALLLVLFTAYGRLAGVLRSTLIVWGVIAGTLGHAVLFGLQAPPSTLPPVGGFLHRLTLQPVFDPGVLLAFLFCFLALAANDLGSIQSIGEMLRLPDLPVRLRRGIIVTGVANSLAGFFGILGPVNFSLSPGVVAATGCASRFTLLPASALLLLLSFSPAGVALAGHLPDVVVGSVLLYILAAQVGAGITLLFTAGPFLFRHGLVVGLPLLLGTIIAFLPPDVLASFPPVLRPILGNGFVLGTIAVLLLEHLILSD